MRLQPLLHLHTLAASAVAEVAMCLDCYHLTQLQTLYFTELKPQNQKMSALRVAAYVDTLDGKSQLQLLDSIAWTVARKAERAKRAAERTNEGILPPPQPL